MKAAIIILFLFFCNNHYGQITGRVVSISDGDTFTLLIKEDKLVKIRLHGIDCPEKGQDFGNRAKAYTTNKIFNKVITVYISDTDRYGRMIAIVALADGTLNEQLLRNGLAWHYCRYDKNEHWHKLQDSATVQKVGIWSRPDAIAPWLYRKK